MSKYIYSKGDDYPPDTHCDAAEAGINVTDGNDVHGNRIVIKVYGIEWQDDKAIISAKKLRDEVLRKLTNDAI